jgi:hypothetical protein
MAKYVRHGIHTYVGIELKVKGSGQDIGQPCQLMMDETAVNKVVSYCSKTNCILGIARQGTARHGEFKVESMESVSCVQLHLESGDLKHCTEATVMAVAPYRKHRYGGLAILVSGSVKGKREEDNFQEQLKLIAHEWEAARRPGGVGCEILGPLVVSASDGDAARRRDFVDEYLSKEITTVPDLQALLGHMPLLDLRVGPTGMVGSFDWKHLIKRMRLRFITKVMGITVSSNGILTSQFLKRLLETGLEKELKSVFDPADRQNVPLAVACLRAVATLSELVDLPEGVPV